MEGHQEIVVLEKKRFVAYVFVARYYDEMVFLVRREIKFPQIILFVPFKPYTQISPKISVPFTKIANN